MSITNEAFQKSMERLQNMAMAKGTQLHHTSSDSNPGTWPGGAQEDMDEHEGDIYIDDNGTDYSGVRKALAAKIRKSLALTPAEVAIADGKNPLPFITDKISKGGALTNAESWAVKGGYDAEKGGYKNVTGDFSGMTKGKEKPGAADTPGEYDGATSVPPTHAGDDTTDEAEADAAKSFSGAVDASLELQKGLELSPFLYEFTRAVGEALSGSEARVTKSLSKVLAPYVARVEAIEKALVDYSTDQGDFNKSLAEAVVGIGQTVGGNVEAATQAASQPVGPPKSQARATAPTDGIQVINKSGPGGLDMDLNKAQLTDAMVEMVQKGKLNALDVVKFEGNGEILPSTRQKVIAYISGNN